MPQLTCPHCREMFDAPALASPVTCPHCKGSIALTAPAVVEDEFALQPPPGQAPESNDELALQPAAAEKAKEVDTGPKAIAPAIQIPNWVPPVAPASGKAPARSPAKAPVKAPIAKKNATGKVTPVKVPSERTPAEESAAGAAPAGPIGLILAGVGGCLMLAAIVLLLIGPLRAPAVNVADLKKQQEKLAQDLTQAEFARKPMLQQRDAAQAALDTERSRATDLADHSKRLDQSFETLAAANARNLEDFKKQQESTERARQKSQEGLAAFGEGDASRAVPKLEKTVVVIITDCGSGSGFILNDAGLVATNYHVVEGCSKLTVKLQQRDSKDQIAIDKGIIRAVNPERDLALIQLPACPPEVGENGKYPCVSLRTDKPALTGENVMAIGNPGLENVILDYTVTKGIVSNADRSLDGKQFIQVSAVVNPGNSGGPLFDSLGAVLGVVAAKGINVEAMTFVIPARDLSTFMNRMNDEAFCVKDTLEAWEKTHRPLTALQRNRKALADKPAVALPNEPSGVSVSPDGSFMYILSGFNGRVQEFNLKTKTLGRECRAECVLAGIAPYGASGEYLLTNSVETSKTLRINCKTMTLSGEVKTPDPAINAVGYNGSLSYALLLREGGRPWLVNQNSFEKSSQPGLWPVGDNSAYYYSAAANPRWLLFAILEPGNTTIQLQAYPLLQCQPYLSQLLALTRDPNHAGTREEENLREKLSGMCKTFDLSILVTAQEGKLSHKMLTWLPGDHFIFGRRVFKVGTKIECEGSFDPSPLSAAAADQPKEVRADIHFMENIFTVSADGKYAASGLCVYDVATRKILKQLPFATALHTFTNDGKGMILLGARGLYCFDDWQADFPAVDSK